jgi:hypothetical protein
MKKGELLRRIKAQGCVFVKHGKKHDVYNNPRTGIEERIPRHSDNLRKLKNRNYNYV